MKAKQDFKTLGDIVEYHLIAHEGTMKGKTTLGQICNLEADIKNFFKEFLQNCSELGLQVIPRGSN